MVLSLTGGDIPAFAANRPLFEGDILIDAGAENSPPFPLRSLDLSPLRRLARFPDSDLEYCPRGGPLLNSVMGRVKLSRELVDKRGGEAGRLERRWRGSKCPWKKMSSAGVKSTMAKDDTG
ncbi:hypothetical protein AKJ16_DCAP17311 [Drosera capensis]